MKTPAYLLLHTLVALYLAETQLIAQGDDFNDGGDQPEWTRLAPLQGVGIATTFSFPGGDSYRIQCAEQNVDPQLGPPRAGSLRADVSYSDFYVGVDISYSPAVDQNIGILARVKEPNLGALDAYAATYNPTEGPNGRLYISKISDEVTEANFAQIDVPDQGGVDLRLVFEGEGANLKAELFALGDLKTAIATIAASDASYTAGNCGIFTAADEATTPVDVIFDNYLALPTKPVGFEIVDVRIVGGLLEIDFLSKPLWRYAVDRTSDLADWSDVVTDEVVGALAERTTFSIAVVPGVSLLFRIREL